MIPKTTTSIFFLIIILFGCKDEILQSKINKYTNVVKGDVILQNQTEHSNALVYIDGFNRGVSTDSSGNYILQFSEKDSIYSGEFKVRYFLNDYDMDSSRIFIEKGKIKLDTLDVDREGKIKTKELKQTYSVEGWTDKQEYRIGDYLKYTERRTNLSGRTLYFSGGGDAGPLPWVSLYYENYPPIFLFFHDPYGTDFNLFIKAGEYYEGSVRYKVPTKINYSGVPLPHGLYLVKSGLYTYDQHPVHSNKKLRDFIRNDWWKISRGKTPKYDIHPAKYKLPIVG
ncbi:MAG: hypothetical protein FD143_605 [Ignavibacteria bacterium]|nr:MAG: hypothetical protein FD143_605 [Ignavibacteria bacterium]KAF0161435.1 MAG: hypothetical protein FD188_806 [Ignavibacteria bacterium]